VIAAALVAAVVVDRRCPAARVHYGADARVTGSLRSLPWVQTSNGAFTGHLFYWSATSWGRARAPRAQIFTTVVQGPVNPKVLWISRGAATGQLMIRGRRLDGTGSFQWRAGYVAGYQHPSYVPIPSVGCWRVLVSSGRLSGSVVFRAVNHS